LPRGATALAPGGQAAVRLNVGRALLDTRDVTAAVGVRVRRRRFLHAARPVPRSDLELLGTDGGGWTVPLDALKADSVCYLVGIGHDISLELELVRRVGCHVHSFDPVPSAVAYAREVAAGDPKIEIHPVGVWSCDTTVTFHAPRRDGYVSHSAVDLHGTESAFQAPVRSLSSLMRELGHDRIDLLKLSAEGAEFEIVEHVLTHDLAVGVLCLEFSQPVVLRRVREAVGTLRRANFELVHVRIDRSGWGWQTTFVRRGPG
jgi:FkbM family methyltransferase